MTWLLLKEKKISIVSKSFLVFLAFSKWIIKLLLKFKVTWITFLNFFVFSNFSILIHLFFNKIS